MSEYKVWIEETKLKGAISEYQGFSHCEAYDSEEFPD